VAIVRIEDRRMAGFTDIDRSEWVWNDGGRCGSGYVGLTGDCVVRAIAIATGISYRDVYREIGQATEKSPRHGVPTRVAEAFLAARGWRAFHGIGDSLFADALPSGVVIVHLVSTTRQRGGHFCTVIDHVIHDTWNPSEDERYCIGSYWTNDAPEILARAKDAARGSEYAATANTSTSQSDEQLLTQKEFERILHRLRSLDNTAKNHASTEGEKRNALRMMQNLMLRHNLSRGDIVGDDDVDRVAFTRVACPVNGMRAYTWEKDLAAYLTKEIFPLIGWYFGRKWKQTLFWFYGPREDVENCLLLFRELLVTIAASAHLQYGGYSRGSGASYAEGYVRGLPRERDRVSEPGVTAEAVVSETALIHARTLAMKRAARNWLALECEIELTMGSGAGRDGYDPQAAAHGRQDGAKHDLTAPGRPKRLTHRS